MNGMIGRGSPLSGPDVPDVDPGVEYAPLRAMVRQAPTQVPPHMSLRETLALMSQSRSDAAVIVDQERGLPLGIVTLRDVLRLIVFEAGPLQEPVAAFMIGAPLTIAADAPAHRAKVLMAKRGIHHVLLVDGEGRLAGVVSQTDLLGLGGGGSDALVDAIAAARDVEAMALAADKVRRRGAELFASGMGVEALCQWMSGLNDLIAIRIIELIEDEFDLPGVPWCWMVFGSEGRLEQTFSTDQDNGLVFLPTTPEETEGTRAAFVPFAKAVNTALHLCGFERCRGDIMAGNPAWCLSQDEWWGKFDTWLRVPEPEALLHGSIFFDFRPLYGSFDLVDRLRNRLLAEAANHPRFFRALAESALSCNPPLGWAGQFTYEKDRDNPRTIDLKLRGARLFVDAARLWGLINGVWSTNTADRLRAAGAAANRAKEDVAAEVEAFHLVQRFRIHQQLLTRDRELVNRIDPSDLNELHRLMLKECFKQAKKLQLRLRQNYGL